MSSVHARHHIMMRGNVAENSESSEATTFLFTSESVGEGHPGEQSKLNSYRFYSYYLSHTYITAMYVTYGIKFINIFQN